MAQIKVGSGLIKPKAINVFLNGTWKLQKIARIFNNGIWKDIIQYIKKIYENGTEFHNFNTVKNLGGNSFSKLSGYMRLQAWWTDRAGYVEIEPTVTFDLTNFNKLYIEWQQTGAGTGMFTGSIFVKNLSNQILVKYDQDGNKNLNTSSVDVSSLTGNFRISVQAFSNSTGGIDLKVYKIWLE